MNNLELVMEKPVNMDACQFGLSTLHAWIRNMEWVLHLAYKLPLQKYNERLTVDEKALVQETKHQIQNKIRDEMGILVDCVKQGSGNTNDGNTARKFFQNYNKVAEITGVHEEFVKRIYILLQVMASKEMVDIGKFKIYCLDTTKLYINMYSWYPMPSPCHMILIHGSTIIDSFSVLIGQLSEEAQEARNKDFKRCRENNTRKCTAKNTKKIPEDIMRYLFMTSDPYISSHRKVSKNKVKELMPEAEELLIRD